MFCAYTRPRYQVSVYRTIGPLVLCLYRGTDVRSAFTRQVSGLSISSGVWGDDELIIYLFGLLQHLGELSAL